MTLLSSAIPNMVNGVSQQPYPMRLASQADEQVNGLSSVVDGLRKRPPTRHVAKIANTPYTDAFIHTINRDTVERYTVVIANNDLKVYRLDGTEVTVNFPNGKGYITQVNPSTAFKALTVADYTFVLNQERTAARGAQVSSTRPFEALVWVRQGAYNQTYTVTLAGHTVTYNTPDGSVAAHGAQIKTETIAASLRASLLAHFNAGQFTINQTGSVLHISRNTPDFTVSASDSTGDTFIRVVKGEVQRFSDLPARAVNGFRVKIRGDNSSAFSSYYVEYDDQSGGASNYGVWRESIKGGEQTHIDPATMPFVLVREANGTFTFRNEPWIERKAGDLDSCPFPSFVGRKIEDIFFHRNRLGFISDENIIFSRAGDFFNFFRETAVQVLDTDPIDVAVSHTKVSILRHAVSFNESLLLFSDQTQFIVSATELLTPKTISVNQTTEFECSLQARPVGIGKNVYFAVNRGQFSGVQEYFLDGDTKTNDAIDVTAHVPRYIPGNLIKLAGSANEDTLVCLSKDKRNEVYVYKFYFNQDEKLQSSWSRWVFPSTDTVLNVDFIESDLWLVIQRADGVFLEVVPIEPGRVDPGLDYMVMLDRRLSQATVVSRTFLAGQVFPEGITEFRLPYVVPQGAEFVIVGAPGDATYKPGQVISYTTRQDNGTVYRVRGNLTQFYCGTQYSFRYRFSTLVVREEAAGGGQTAIGQGRLQLRRMTVQFSRTGYFRAEVTPSSRDTYRYVYSGRVVGSGQNIIGQTSLETGKFDFPIMARNENVTIELVNDKPLPCSFLTGEWEAFYLLRSRRA